MTNTETVKMEMLEQADRLLSDIPEDDTQALATLWMAATLSAYAERL